MKAAVLHTIGGTFEIEDVAIDDPRGGEVLVDVKASSLCHSDITVAENDFGRPLPIILGHEVAGVVTAVGPEVRGLAVGDKVVGCLTSHCGTCQSCLLGHIWECQNFAAVAARSADLPPRLTLDGKAVNQIAGLGGFAEQILVHQSTLVTVPPDMPLDRAALLGCGVITGAGAAINTAGVRFGDTVAVIGCGGVGLSVVQGAAIAGALEIIAIDVVAEKAERARTFGATATVCAVREDAVAAVRDLTGGAGVHYSFEVVGLPETAAQALQMVRRGGVVYMLGVQRPGSELTLDPFADLVYRQRSLHGVYMGSTNFKYDSPIYSQMYLQGRFNLDGLVSQTVAIEDINRAYDDLKAGRVIRSVITF